MHPSTLLGNLLLSHLTDLIFLGLLQVFNVARAKGISLDPGLLNALQTYTFKSAAHRTRSSMLNDLEAGKRIEIAELSGAVVRYGKEVGVPTPIHSVAMAVLMPIQQARSQQRAAGIQSTL